MVVREGFLEELAFTLRSGYQVIEKAKHGYEEMKIAIRYLIVSGQGMTNGGRAENQAAVLNECVVSANNNG